MDNWAMFLHAVSLPENALRAENRQRNQWQTEWRKIFDAGYLRGGFMSVYCSSYFQR